MELKHLAVAALAALSLSLVAANVTTPYTTRIVGMDSKSVPGSIVYTYKCGSKTWTATNAVQRMAVAINPDRYSKLRIILAAKQAGKWDLVKTFLTEHDLLDEWNACQYIEEGNAYYIQATNTVVTSGIATDAEVKQFLAAAVDKDL